MGTGDDHAGQNQSTGGVRVLCITVPAVTELCRPVPLHCQSSRWCISRRCRRNAGS